MAKINRRASGGGSSCSEGRSKGTILDVDCTHICTHTTLVPKTVVVVSAPPPSRPAGRRQGIRYGLGPEVRDNQPIPTAPRGLFFFFLTGSLRFFRVSLAYSPLFPLDRLSLFSSPSLRLSFCLVFSTDYILYQIPCIGRVLGVGDLLAIRARRI